VGAVREIGQTEKVGGPGLNGVTLSYWRFNFHIVGGKERLYAHVTILLGISGDLPGAAGSTATQ
jgi:hypothetical protein